MSRFNGSVSSTAGSSIGQPRQIFSRVTKHTDDVTLQHPRLDSNVATAAALLNEWLKWCEEIGIGPRQTTSIMESFRLTQEEYDIKHNNML